MPKSIKPAVAGILFIIGAIVGSMLAYVAMASRLDSNSVVQLMVLWPTSPVRFGWWAWSLGGGLILSLAYAARQIAHEQ